MKDALVLILGGIAVYLIYTNFQTPAASPLQPGEPPQLAPPSQPAQQPTAPMQFTPSAVLSSFVYERPPEFYINQMQNYMANQQSLRTYRFMGRILTI